VKLKLLINSPKKSLSMLFPLLVLALVAALPGYGTDYYTSLLTSVFLYVILTVSWAMFSGPTGYMSLASAAFLGVGAYTMVLVGKELPVPVVVFLGGLFSFILAFLVGLACLKMKGVYFTIFTFGLSELIRHSVLFYEIEVTGEIGRFPIALSATVAYYSMLAIVVVLLLTVYTLGHSKFGLALQSIGQAESAAAHTGVNVNAVKVVTYAVSAFFMGLAGAVMVTQWGYIDPTTAFNVLYSFMPVLMTIFGGVQQISGQILGATVLTLIAQQLVLEFPYYYMLLFGLLVVSVILFFPSGLIGLVGLVTKRWKRGAAK